jgi:hypothetical protein
MSDIEAETLLPSPRMRENAESGEITQLHRGQRYAEAGDTFELGGNTFEVVEVTERKLGDMTDEDARAEGARDLAHYREILERAHDNFEWDDDADIYRHRFEKQ